MLAFQSNEKSMKKFSESVFYLCKKYEGYKGMSPNPAHFYIQLLQRDLNLILESSSVVHTEFFNLWDSIIRLVPREVAREVISSVKVTKLLYETIIHRDLIEDDNQQDSVLSGSLSILTTLDQVFHSELKDALPELYNEKFLHFLLSDALFDRTRVDNDSEDSEMVGTSDTAPHKSNFDDKSYPL